MNSDDVSRILVEIRTDKPPATPDDKEMAALRVQLTKECNAIIAAGYDVDVPHEIPDDAD